MLICHDGSNKNNLGSVYPIHGAKGRGRRSKRPKATGYPELIRRFPPCTKHTGRAIACWTIGSQPHTIFGALVQTNRLTKKWFARSETPHGSHGLLGLQIKHELSHCCGYTQQSFIIWSLFSSSSAAFADSKQTFIDRLILNEARCFVSKMMSV